MSTLLPTLALALAGCGQNPVYLSTPTMTAADARACQHLKDALPDELDGERRRLTQPAAALGAAWGGDPPVTLVCGVDVPAAFDKYAACQEADGVGWFVPDDEVADENHAAELTTVGYRPRITVTVPGRLRPEGVAAVLSALAPVVKQNLQLVDRCR